jgi:hypothetical protein
MSKTRVLLFSVLLILMAASLSWAEPETFITVKPSGPGAVNDSTLKAGEPVSLDVYFTNHIKRKGFTIGFKFYSDDIKKVVHIADSGAGLNPLGDIKGHNGWDDKSVWDLFGIKVNHTDWDGILPDTVGIGGLNVKLRYEPHKEAIKHVSFDIIVPETGTLFFDSSYFPPGGIWLYLDDDGKDTKSRPDWGGPYKYTVVK